MNETCNMCRARGVIDAGMQERKDGNGAQRNRISKLINFALLKAEGHSAVGRKSASVTAMRPKFKIPQ